MMNKSISKNKSDILEQAKNMPALPGVYLFKKNDQILYIGKAKNLKRRVSSYFKESSRDLKSDLIVNSCSNIDKIVTKNELEAMLLEAELIRSNMPKFNILLKFGQPFLYLLITSPYNALPEIKIVRNKKEKGTYFGPFLEKGSPRKVYNFLTKTFKLNLCKKKIDTGCLEYHIGNCAGNCRIDFDKNKYIKRLELAKIALKKGHKKFLTYLEQKIKESNLNLEFERSKDLHEYYKAFYKVFEVIDTINSPDSLFKSFGGKDIWILSENQKALFLFSEKNSAIKTKKIFSLSFGLYDEKNYLDYFLSYYRSFDCPHTILINFDLDKDNKILYQDFLKQWNKKNHNILILKPREGHFLNLVNLATIHAQEEINRQKSLSQSLKKLLKLDIEPHTIDCFDISHKQGHFMVGSCIRFKDGEPDKDNFRRFKIKDVVHQDDCACLQEIVKRRYADKKNIPDLILIDGGKGQLNSILKILPDVQVASIAKKEETVFSKKLVTGKKLNQHNYSSQILIAIRDYAHHFAISYHRKLSKLL
ncbi:excinuclease ABC subunit UvrC [Candidatus Dependentiae bacterium]